MVKALIFLFTAALLSGCATPVTTLRHESGSTVTCGGPIDDDLAQDAVYLVGPLGVQVWQTMRDERCVKDRIAEGFTVVQ